ncbi:MAG TPA: AMP-binding protein, partial [Actinomycetota bacterium]|nr:AMP-binding protein [Actinomycetota bacterium]
PDEQRRQPAQQPATLPALFVGRARLAPGNVALREKAFGIWREHSWSDYEARVREIALGMVWLGIQPGDRVAILSDDRPEWVFAELGAVTAGATSVGVYPTSPAAEVGYVLEHSGARVVVAENQEQVDKILEVKLPSLERIVVIDRRGLRGYDDPRLMPFEDVLSAGAQMHAADPSHFERLVSERTPDEIAMIVYTSGTTGPPKGAMLSQANLAASIALTKSAWDEITDGDRVLSYLPLNHVAEKIFTIYFPIAFGVSASFAESIDTVPENLREVEPTIFLGVPRIWEKMAAGIEIRMRDASPVKRALFRFWLKRGQTYAERRLANGGKLPASVAPLYALGWLLVYRPLKKRLGLNRCRIAVSGAAPIAPGVLHFFHAIGLPVREGWGQTESCGVGTISPGDDIRIGTIGKAFEGVEIRIADDGEILMRGPHVFAGYYRNPKATAETVDGDGWLHTGDVGRFDDNGHLHIVDRMKDIIITAGGKNISPSEIENKLKQSPYVKEAIVVGDRRPYCVALIGIELDTVGDWATRQRIPFTTYGDLAAKQEVVRLIEEHVHRINKELAPVEQIKTFRLLPKELDHEDGELTATQKVRRGVLAERFESLVEEMYKK